MLKGTLTIKHRFWFIRWNRVYDCVIPKEWKQITQFHLLTFCKVKDLKKAKDALSFRFAKLPPWVFFQMKKIYLKQLNLAHSFWFEKEPVLEKILIKSFKCGGRKYYGPDDGFANVVVMENAIADSYYINFHKQKKEQDLLICIAALYRPTNLYIRFMKALNGRDIRCSFNKETVERRAEKFKNLPQHLKEALLIQYQGTRNWVIEENKELFPGKTQQEIKNYGWAGIIYDLAGDKLGTTKEVEKLNFPDTLLLLRKAEDDRKKREENKPKSKVA
jgi:hypothetical protein